MQGEQRDPELEHCDKVVGEIVDVLELPASIVTADQRAMVAIVIARERAIARTSSERPLRRGRPEHLTLAAAEQHADWVRDASPNLTVVGQLLVVAVDAVRELREQNTVLRSAREGVREFIDQCAEYDPTKVEPSDGE